MGWGCGGNCAVNISGESETVLRNNPPDVHLEDHGTMTQKENDPGGSVINTTRWKFGFHGTSTTGDNRREYELQTDINECTRTEEMMTSREAAATKKTTCPGPPKRWKLICERKDVPVKNSAQPAWMCSPQEHLNAFGTEFPWVFAIEGSLTTVVAGEPHPSTTYETSPPSVRHD